MSTVSAIIITKNEEKNLPRCLESLKWANEIIVLDSGSTDNTLEIAKSYNAKIFSEEWKGYTQQKNSAVAKTQSDWIVSLDADEEFSEDAQNDIQSILKNNHTKIEGYAFRRKVFYLGKWICHGDWYPDYVVRLWKRNSGQYEGGRVHESVQIKGQVEYLKSEILHYTYKDITDQKARMEKYAKLWAQDQFDRKRSFRFLDLLLRPPARFLRAILLKSGWMDGWRGWFIAWMCAKEVKLKYQNLKTLWKNADQNT
jgi:glycosyltransferase involved in cell wall biosynthesis